MNYEFSITRRRIQFCKVLRLSIKIPSCILPNTDIETLDRFLILNIDFEETIRPISIATRKYKVVVVV